MFNPIVVIIMKKDRSNIRRAVNEGALKAEVLNGIAYEYVKRITHTSLIMYRS